MNEKIRELAEQANIPKYNLEYGTELCIAPHLEKFAELIIQECANVCKTGGVSNSDYNTGRLHCVYDIKQHFGIEK